MPLTVRRHLLRRATERGALRVASLTTAEMGEALETGFLHQIRASMAHFGNPVLGDREYGEESGDSPRAPLARRPLRHAKRLVVDQVRAEVAPPADFEAVLAALAP